VRRSRLPGTPEPMHTWRGFGGIALAGDSWGAADGPLVVLLHGSGQTRHSWARAGRALAAMGYHVVAFDARGHGDSDWAPDGDYSNEAKVGDLEAIVQQVGSGPVALVGASMGGVTSLLATAMSDLDVVSLVLVDIAARVETRGAARIRAFMDQHEDGFDTLDEVADAIASYQPHRARPESLDGLAKNVRLGEDGRYRWHWDPAMRAVRPDPDERRRRMEEAARNVSMPTLLVRGGNSDVLTEQGAREFLELCPHAEFVSVSGAAHMVAGDHNDAFAGAVSDFLLRTNPNTMGRSRRNEPTG
jgi:pimeloyl-ACP methyl ester carboxylesterase